MAGEQDSANQGIAFQIDLPEPTDPLDGYLRRTAAQISQGKATTGNGLAILLVASLCCSVVLHLVCLVIRPDMQIGLGGIFDKWYAVMSPLAGLAIGSYFGVNRSSFAHRVRV